MSCVLLRNEVFQRIYLVSVVQQIPIYHFTINETKNHNFHCSLLYSRIFYFFIFQRTEIFFGKRPIQFAQLENSNYYILLSTSSAVSLTAYGTYAACRLEGAPLRFARSYSLRSWGPILPYSLGWALSYPSRYAGVGERKTHRHTNIALYIEDCFFYFQ